jgi:hypothetical protein
MPCTRWARSAPIPAADARPPLLPPPHRSSYTEQKGVEDFIKAGMSLPADMWIGLEWIGTIWQMGDGTSAGGGGASNSSNAAHYHFASTHVGCGCTPSARCFPTSCCGHLECRTTHVKHQPLLTRRWTP